MVIIMVEEIVFDSEGRLKLRKDVTRFSPNIDNDDKLILTDAFKTSKNLKKIVTFWLNFKIGDDYLFKNKSWFIRSAIICLDRSLREKYIKKDSNL